MSFKSLNYTKLLPYIICSLFFILYTTLSVVRHLHYGSFGFDLGLTDQVIWRYSQFKAPITTIHYYPFTSLLADHFELIFVFLAPFYWIYNSVLTLLVVQAFAVSFSGLPIYFLAKWKNINKYVCFAILFSYLTFYGIQNTLWFDAHSLAFGASFLAWFLYFLFIQNNKWIFISFFLTIICKEDLALLTLLIGFVYFVISRKKIGLYIIVFSVIYLLLVFLVYFPYFTHDGYRYGNNSGFLANLRPSMYFDTEDKRDVLFYSTAWFGFLPLFAPLFVIPAFGDISHYFLFSSLARAQGLFEQYRITLAPLLVLPTIIAIGKYKFLNNKFIAIYLVVFALFFQYSLHLPLSYLAKSWFWHKPSAVNDINYVLEYLPPNASVVSQNNITPHIAHRDQIFTLWPTDKTFPKNSPCGKSTCNWFRWAGNPQFLVVDTSSDFDIRHFLVSRPDYLSAISNIKKDGYVKVYKQKGDATLYKIIKHV